MISITAILLIFLSIAWSQNVIIGVDPSRRHEYEREDLACPTTGLKLTPDMINDGYCDCPDDGFDEPGTAACSKGKFFCANEPFKAKYIQASRVNDGVCDCCDGSDEYLNLFGKPCENTCNEQLKAFKREKYIEKASIKKAHKVAQKMKLEAAQKRQELNEQLREINAKLDEIKQKAETIPHDIRENPEAFEEFIREYDTKIKQLENLLSSSNCTVKSFEVDANVEQQSSVQNPSWSQILGEKIVRVKSILKGLSKSSGQLTTTITQYIPAIVTRTIIKFEPTLSPEMRLNELEWEQQDLEGRAEALRFDLEQETYYGPESIYLIYKDKCFSHESSPYQYYFCWFKDASQSSPGNYVRLGSWKGWYEHANGTFDFHKALFTDGYRCGATSREATVDLICGYKEEIISVFESQPCKFLFKFSTPAACF